MEGRIFSAVAETPAGPVEIVCSDTAVTQAHFGVKAQEDEDYRRRRWGNAVICGPEGREPAHLEAAVRQLEEYFEGKRRDFDLPLHPAGTVFQKKVWDALRTIPYGETRSYKQMAELIGNPKACRAVGMANNRNPIAIFVPCHRVIGADGKLVGYAGGLSVKSYLLNLELTHRNQDA